MRRSCCPASHLPTVWGTGPLISERREDPLPVSLGADEAASQGRPSLVFRCRRIKTGSPDVSKAGDSAERRPKAAKPDGGWAAAHKTEAGEADFPWFHTHTGFHPCFLASSHCLQTWRPLWPESLLQPCAVEVRSERQQRRPSTHKDIYWTLRRALLVQGSPLSFAANPPAPSPPTRGPSPRVGSGGNGEGAAKIRRLSTGSWPPLVPRHMCIS